MSPRTPLAAAVVTAALMAGAAPLAGQTGAAAPATPAATAAPAAVAPAPRTIRSWTSDGTTLAVGDVITILVDEYTLASADRDDLAAQGRARDVGLRGAMGTTRMGGVVGTGHDVEDTRFGEASRRDRFQAEISARVVEVTGGTVRLEGTKRLSIDEHEQEVTISGWVRAADVATDNTIPSWKLADAQIAYASNGELVKAGGFWTKILNLIVP